MRVRQRAVLQIHFQRASRTPDRSEDLTQSIVQIAANALLLVFAYVNDLLFQALVVLE